MICKAYIRGTQYFCDRCQYTWDIDDEAPECELPGIIDGDTKRVGKTTHDEEMKKIREKLK